MKNKLSIFGTGGHAKVVIEAANLNGFVVTELFDDDVNKISQIIYNLKVRGPIEQNFSGCSIIAIGNNLFRKKISERVWKANWKTIIHPSAIISNDVFIGEGTVIMAGVIIQSGTRIGKHCILNTGACVDHDCMLGDFVHIGPNSSVAGSVSFGEGVFIGIGSSIIQNINIGNWSIIGAGSVVITDLQDNSTAVGIPAKTIKIRNE